MPHGEYYCKHGAFAEAEATRYDYDMIGFNFATSGWFIILAIIWTLPWKGYALWLAARNNQPWWFVIMLVVNTLAILEIIYIFAIGRPQLKKKEAESSSAVAR